MRLVGLYETGFGNLGISLVQDIGANRGGTIELRANTALPIGDRLVLAPEIGAVYASARHLNTWYGVTEVQAALAGVTPFQTGAGWESIYFQLNGGVRITDTVSVVFRGELRQLTPSRHPARARAPAGAKFVPRTFARGRNHFAGGPGPAATYDLGCKLQIVLEAATRSGPGIRGLAPPYRRGIPREGSAFVHVYKALTTKTSL